MSGRTPAGPPPVGAAARAYEATVLVAAFAVVGFGATGVVLGILGWFHPPVAIPAGLVATGALTWAWRPWQAAEPPAPDDPEVDPTSPGEPPDGAGRRIANALIVRRPGRAPWWAVAALVAVVVGFVVFNAGFAGEHFTTNRDPGVYNVGAHHLADEGDLTVEPGLAAFGGGEGLAPVAPGLWPLEGPRTLQIQFLHTAMIHQAIGDWIAGTEGLLVTPVYVGALGLAAIGLLGLRFLRPVVAVAATAALGANFALISVVRDSYSEPAMLALLPAGLWALLAAIEGWRRGRPATPRLVVAGVLLGSTALVRIDAGVATLGIAVLIAVLVRRGEASRGRDAAERFRVAGRIGAGVLVVLVVSQLDGRLRSPLYLGAHTTERRLQAGAVVLALLVGLGVLARFDERLDRVRELVVRHRGRLAIGAVLTVVVIAVGLGVIRPQVQTVTDPDRGSGASNGVATVQEARGLEVEPTRTYAERSVISVSWYTGPLALVLGGAGVALVAWRAVRGDWSAGALAVAAVAVPAAVVYFWRPSIFPDHPWMIRRFTPVIIPGLVLLGGVALDGVIDAARRAPNRLAAVGAGLVATAAGAALVLGPLRLSVPLHAYQYEDGMAAGIERVCDRLGPDDAAVITHADGGATLAPALSTFCDVPVAPVDPDYPWARRPGRWAEMAAAVADRGGRLWVLGGSNGYIAEIYPPAADPGTGETIRLYDDRTLRPSLVQPPTSYRDSARPLALVRVPPPG